MSSMAELAAAAVDVANALAAVERADPDRLLLAVNEDSPADQLAAAINAVEFDYEQAKERRDRLNALLVEVVKNRGPQTIGKMRYWLTHPKTVKPRALLPLMQAVLAATGGDEEAFARALSANAFKVGQCRSILAGAFDEHFETVVRDKLESGEVAPKELASAPADLLLR